jgi:hypothetical protein
MELFRSNNKIYRHVIIKGDMIYAYLCYNNVAIQEQLTGIALLIKEMSRKITSVTDTTHCINKEILSSGKVILICQ